MSELEIVLGMISGNPAKHFRALGIKGKVFGGTTCPVSMYLRMLKFKNVYISLARSYTDYMTQSCQHSPGLMEFITGFDRGLFPELEC